MTDPEFIDAYRKGQGRAIIALRSGAARPSFSLLRRLILRWQGHDAQLESSRGEYVADTIEASTYAAQLEASLHALLITNKGYWAHSRQRMSTLGALVARGNSSARDVLHKTFEAAKNLEEQIEWAEVIVGADGLAGLDHVVRHLPDVIPDELIWRISTLKEDAEARESEDAVRAWMAQTDRPHVIKFAALLDRDRSMKREPSPRLEAIPFEELKQAILAKERVPYRATWSRKAPREELRLAVREMLVSDDPVLLNELGRILSRRPRIFNLDRLLLRARSWRGPSPNPFIPILENLKDAKIRALAFETLSSQPSDFFALMRQNALEGDERQMMEALRHCGDWDAFNTHGVVLDIIQACHETDIDGRDLLKWVYEHSPCSFCRESAVRRLIEVGHAPEEMLRECLCDCVTDTRDMAKAALDSRD